MKRRERATMRRSAVARLTERWHEQAARYPSLPADIPLARFVAVNLAAAMRNERARCGPHGVVCCEECRL